MTSSCAELQRDAAGLMALPDDDPDRAAALRHAASCEPCQRALAEGARLGQLLDAEPPPAPPRPEVLLRIEREVRAALAPPPLALGWSAGALLAGWGALALIKHGDAGALPRSLLVLALALVALLAARRRAVAVGATLAVSTLLALSAGAHGDVAPGVGVVCIVTELVAALFPLTAVVWCARRAGGAPHLLELAAVAGAGALAGQAVLAMACPNDFVGHTLPFHAGGVALAILGGAALARIALGGAARRAT